MVFPYLWGLATNTTEEVLKALGDAKEEDQKSVIKFVLCSVFQHVSWVIRGANALFTPTGGVIQFLLTHGIRAALEGLNLAIAVVIGALKCD